jgi:hypothetical protein
MKKLIGVVAVVLTLVLTVIYRQLMAKPAKEEPPRATIAGSLREGMTLSCLLLQ